MLLESLTVGLGVAVAALAWEIRRLRRQPPMIELHEVPVEVVMPDPETLKLLAQRETELKFSENQSEKLSEQLSQTEQVLRETQAEVRKQKGRAASAHTSKGQILEKWTPFLTHSEIDEHWKPQDWSFMGNPLDYIVWDWHQDADLNNQQGKIVFLDVKAAKSQLSTKQRRIRDLVKAGRIEWREIRLD
jgi:predicted Holliday junction resolvase-like endonuclease